LHDLLHMDMDSDGIFDVLGIDLNDPLVVNDLIKKESIYYRSLCKTCSKKDGLEIVLSSQEYRLRQNAQLMKAFTYPMFLCGLSLMMLTLLGIWILPNLSNMLHSMNTDSQPILINLMQFMIGAEWSFLLCCLLFLRLIYPKEKMNHYIWMSNHWKGNIWKTWVSSVFLIDFNHLIEVGISLTEILEIMRNSGNPIIRSLIRNVQNRLKGGIPLSEAFEYLDEGLLRLMRIQENERKIGERLEVYGKTLDRIMTYKLNKIAKFVLAFAYVQISVVVLIAYQMMFYPLNLLEAL